MAGTLAGFDADDFRTQIRNVMQMAAPTDASRQATFIFPATTVSDAPTDSSGVPFAPGVTVARTAPDPVKVPVGIEFQRGIGAFTSVGSMEADRVIVTLLDLDYAKVVGFEYMTWAGRKWKLRKELLESALGPVGVHQIECEAMD